MKKLLIILFIIPTLFGYKEYNQNIKPFIGYWIGKSNNTTFHVRLYESFNMIKGDYWLTKNTDGIEKTIYKSNRVIDDFFNLKFGYAIAVQPINNNTASGIIKDNVLIDDGIHTFKEGLLNLELLSTKSVRWKIKTMSNLNNKHKKEPLEFIIPTNLILTKVK